MEDERRREIGLFRYALIREAADPNLSSAQRGRLVRALAGELHRRPDGRVVRISRRTIDRWVLTWRREGFDGLVPKARQSRPRSDASLLDLAVRLRRERADRTAAHIVEMIRTQIAEDGRVVQVPSARTVQRHFVRVGLNSRAALEVSAFGRFEAAHRNDRWIGDGLHGPKLGTGGRAVLLAFIDDHSRLVVGHHWGFTEDTVGLEAALRRGLATRGVPGQVYVDRGSAFISAPLHRACAVLGIHLVHSRAGQPEGRGKIERFFRTVRSQFLVEIEHRGVDDIEQLRRLFIAWLERRYHREPHSETEQSPLQRFSVEPAPTVATPEQLREAFLWSTTRKVNKTALVSFQSNRYEVDPVLVGRQVELIYDPFDLSRIEIRWNDTSFGLAVVHTMRSHVHPKVSRYADADPSPAPGGIDYLGLLEAEHRHATSQSISFADLDPDTDADSDADAHDHATGLPSEEDVP